MKGKIVVGLLLGGIGAIYVFLIYPLLQSSDIRFPSVYTTIQEHNTGVILSEVKDLGDLKDSLSHLGGTQNDDMRNPVVDSHQQAADNICFNTTCFVIEIADTFASRQQGLMNRPSLPQNAGMLFVFDSPGSYGFWMKNTLIPLDIIWLDENLTIVDTTTMIPCTADPCPSYSHQGTAKYALEINAGLVQEYGFSIGDSAQYD